MGESRARAATGAEIDEAFERGDDMRGFFDFDRADLVQPDANELKATTITLPMWLVSELDREAARRGTSRQSVMKNWLVDRADAERGGRNAA